jgi:hypothetical protein
MVKDYFGYVYFVSLYYFSINMWIKLFLFSHLISIFFELLFVD